ncbi:hypothetical protein GCM10009120_51470 [Sphingobacterium siyangense subsp. cladoniae]|uniref:hypothetical protein n=1 Tax=Sphingobacterium siyangense TaxID=459529 RepID=UPI0031F9294D
MKKNTLLPGLNIYTHFFQVAYITTDLQHSIEIFKELYAIEKFLVMPEPIKKEVVRGSMLVTYEVKLAFANIGDTQIELIEPIQDGTGCYSSLLPSSGFCQVFHHIGCRFNERKEWDDFRNLLDTDKHPIAFESTEGGNPFLYLDERKNLGHYVEYMWLDPEQSASLWNAIPQN